MDIRLKKLPIVQDTCNYFEHLDQENLFFLIVEKSHDCYFFDSRLKKLVRRLKKSQYFIFVDFIIER